MSLPIARWGKAYGRETFVKDIVAASIVVALLIPQSLAYAMIAGVPPEIGLYASMLPLIAYALLGSSSSLSVGPVAVVALMTATALGDVSKNSPELYLTGAVTLALLSGLILVILGCLRFGFIANFLSHTVISGFISASCVLIILSQIGSLTGIRVDGDTAFDMAYKIQAGISDINVVSVLIGVASLVFLWCSKTFGNQILTRLGFRAEFRGLFARLAPLIVVLISIIASFLLVFENFGVQVVGAIPKGLPQMLAVMPSLELIESLLFPAFMIAVIGYVESVSVAQTFAAKRRELVDPNQELIGLGAANLASGFSGAIPVAGGFSRSAVNFEAGAKTQAASIFTALGIALASLLLAPVLYYLPKAVLAATIIIAVAGLIDLKIARRTWRYSRSDFLALLSTVFITLAFGVETGVACGVALSLVLHVYRTSKPHIAEVGLIEGTEHFRNVERYDVKVSPKVLTLRQDESLFFVNASQLQRRVLHDVYKRDSIAHVIIQCSAVNELDFSALEMLEDLNQKLSEQGVTLNFSEVKGPVMDKLSQSGFCESLSGQIYLTQFEAFTDLAS